MIQTAQLCPLLRRTALALKEGETPSHDPADLLWDAANAIHAMERTSPSPSIPIEPETEALRRRADRLAKALAAILPLAQAHVQITDDLPGLIEGIDGRRTTLDIILAEDVLSERHLTAPPAEPSGLADLPDDAFLDCEANDPPPPTLDSLDGAILAAAQAIRAQNARRIAGLDPDPQHAIARAEALIRLRQYLDRLDDDVPTGA